LDAAGFGTFGAAAVSAFGGAAKAAKGFAADVVVGVDKASAGAEAGVEAKLKAFGKAPNEPFVAAD
jgi:hypothetical protein